MRPRLLLSLVVALLLVASPASAARDHRAWPRGVAAVGYRSEAALRRAAALDGAAIVRMFPRLRVAEVRPRGDLDGFARAAGRTDGISYVERLALRYPTADPALVPVDGSGRAYEWQWAAVHEDGVPDSVLRAAGSVTIAVVDTGADLSAPDIAAKSPTAFNVTGASVSDPVGHGTFVSALAAGSVTNGEGIAGFGGDAGLMVVQASADGGTFTDLDEANAIVWAVDHGAKIVNLSLAGTDTSSTEQQAIQYATSHGILIVAAAGNEHDVGNPVEYPAALLQPVGSDGQGGTGLAVGASTQDEVRAHFSNTGSYISLAAPGEGVFSALPAGIGPPFVPLPLPGSSAGSYGLGSGTSFAAPEVAGAAALVWAANPLLSAAQVAQVLKQTASGKGSWTPELGYGVIDVAAAVAAADGEQFLAPAVTVSGRQEPSGAIRLSWTGRGAASYRVAVSEDGAPPRILIESTVETNATFSLPFGHRYAFTVAALDEQGVQAAVSGAYLVTLPRVRSTLGLTSSKAAGSHPLQVALTARLAASRPAVTTVGRALLLQAFQNGRWRDVSRSVTARGGSAVWRFTLARGVYRLRAQFPGTDELAASASAPVTIHVG